MKMAYRRMPTGYIHLVIATPMIEASEVMTCAMCVIIRLSSPLLSPHFAETRDRITMLPCYDTNDYITT